MKAKKMDRRLYQQHPGQKQQFKGQTDSWMHNMVKKDETNWGRTGQRMGGDEWLKGTKPQSRRRRRRIGVGLVDAAPWAAAAPGRVAPESS